ncbi:MAG: serine protease [Lachnospiraceae bacterium]|nr:serine protease [Lachnospiraceae bacterium]
MAEQNDKKAEKERSRFVRETVTSSKNRGRRLAKRAAAVVISALIFGVLAAWMFVLTRPFWESRFGEAETSAPEPVTIFVPTQPETTTEAEPETTPPETTSEPETQPSSAEDPFASQWEALQPSVDEEINKKLQEAASRDLIVQQRRAVMAAVNKSVVTVSARNAAADWFDDDPARRDEKSGVIVAVTKREILVLTGADILEEEQQLYAVFANQLEMPAQVKAVDNTFGLAVLSVNRASWSEAQIEGISVIQMGSSTAVDQGQTVMAMGAPMGQARSVLTGSVSYAAANVQGTDTSVRLLQTDISVPDKANGFLVNLDGQMIGWITDRYPDQTRKGFLSAIALFDLTSSIQTLINGEEPALLGILGQSITQAMSLEYELPQGIYINRCIADTPADRAGIQNGDILTMIDDQEISVFQDLDAALAAHRPGDRVKIVIQRMGDGEYAQLELEAVLGSR